MKTIKYYFQTLAVLMIDPTNVKYLNVYLFINILLKIFLCKGYKKPLLNYDVLLPVQFFLYHQFVSHSVHCRCWISSSCVVCACSRLSVCPVNALTFTSTRTSANCFPRPFQTSSNWPVLNAVRRNLSSFLCLEKACHCACIQVTMGFPQICSQSGMG